MKFSVLMAVYHKENSSYFDRAMKSIYDEQTLKPNEIVLVKDGPLSNELDIVVNKWKSKLNDVLKVVSLRENVGLSDALNIGIKRCKYEIIARMDSDDISREDRFEKQIYFLKSNTDIDVIGSWISEFEGDESNIYATRKLPVSPAKIESLAKKRCPLNHVSVMYKKSKVLNAGNYHKFRGIEDYYLWAKMLMNGDKFLNIPEFLVNVRAGVELSRRRGGIKYAFNELILQKEFYKMGFIDFETFLTNVFLRLFARMIPGIAREKVYDAVREIEYYKVKSDRNIYFEKKNKNFLEINFENISLEDRLNQYKLENENLKKLYKRLHLQNLKLKQIIKNIEKDKNTLGGISYE